MNLRGNKEKKDLKALHGMIEQITVDTFGDHEPDGLFLKAVP